MAYNMREVMGMLFEKKQPPQCAYCTHAAPAGDDHLICSRKGPVAPESHCHAFRYDPLKRVPKTARALDFSKYDKTDFSL